MNAAKLADTCVGYQRHSLRSQLDLLHRIIVLDTPGGRVSRVGDRSTATPMWVDDGEVQDQGALLIPPCSHRAGEGTKRLEAPPGFEPGMEVLQTSALPLGDGAGRNRLYEGSSGRD